VHGGTEEKVRKLVGVFSIAGEKEEGEWRQLDFHK